VAVCLFLVFTALVPPESPLSETNKTTEAPLPTDNKQNELEELKLTNLEDGQFLSAIESVELLQKYIENCKKCEHISEAKAEIARLVELKKQKDAAKAKADAIKRLENSYFAFSVCNEDELILYVALVGRKDANSSAFTTDAWFAVAPKTCRDLGKFVRGSLYYRAFNKRFNWEGKEVGFCTANNSFTRFEFPEYQCDGSEMRLGYTKMKVDQESLVLKFPHGPWTYGAIAVSSDGQWGGATNEPDIESAKAAAMRKCGAKSNDCHVETTVRDDFCLSFSWSPHGWGWSMRERGTPMTSEDAYSRCAKHGPGCGYNYTNCNIAEYPIPANPK
jgi:uncharacterized membrane protein